LYKVILIRKDSHIEFITTKEEADKINQLFIKKEKLNYEIKKNGIVIEIGYCFDDNKRVHLWIGNKTISEEKLREEIRAIYNSCCLERNNKFLEDVLEMFIRNSISKLNLY